MKQIYFITSNKGKVEEAKEKLSKINIDVVQKDLGYPEIQAIKLEDVALYGAQHILRNFSQPFILEDAGIFIDSLDGFPGVFSAYVFHTIGCSGILKLMEKTEKEKRDAVFKSVYAYGESGKKPKFFIGECRGKIANEQRGNNGFGYDPIFIADGEKRTFAEMKTAEKNSFSHRGNALEKLIEYIKYL